MKTKLEKLAISSKFAEAEKLATTMGLLCSAKRENGLNRLRVFNTGVHILTVDMTDAGNTFSRFYDAKGACIRTLTGSPSAAVSLIGRVY